MAKGTQDSPNLRSVFLLADQVEIGLRMTGEPTLWTPLRLLPEFPVACVLSALAIGTRLFLRCRLVAFADALTRAPGSDVVRILRRTSSEIMEAFTFLRASGRKLPASFQSMEVLHIAFCALGFPAREAMSRVIRYAFISDAFRVIHREYYSGASRVAVQGDVGWAAVLLATGVQPEKHSEAWGVLRNFWSPKLLNELAKQLPPSARGFLMSRDGRLEWANLTREVEAELANAVSSLIVGDPEDPEGKQKDKGIPPLRQWDEDELLGAWLDGDKRLTHLPHAAKNDVADTFQRMWTKEKGEVPLVAVHEAGSLNALAERIRHILEPGGAPPNIWLAEQSRAAQGDPEPRDNSLAEFMKQPPATFLRNLTKKERKAFDALRSLCETQQFSADWGLQRRLAKVAGVSDPTVTRLFEKIRKVLSVPA